MIARNSIAYKTKAIKAGWMLSSLFLVSFFLVYRYPDALSVPQLWAEDGPVFFKGAYELGLSSLLEPYAGYIHLIPRLIAMTGQNVVSYEYIPAFYNLSSLLFALLLPLYIWVRAPFNNFTKFLFSISIVLIPIGNEVFLTITNIQWIMALVIIIFFISDISTKYLWIDSVLLFFCGLTGPFCLVFLPAVAVLIYLKRKEYLTTKYSCIGLLMYLLTCIVQLIYILSSTRVSENNVSLIDKISSFPHVIYLQFIALTGIDSLYLNKTNFILLGLILFLIFIWLSFSIYKIHYVQLFFITCAFLLMISYTIGLNDQVYILHPVEAGSRYFFIPFVLIIWAFIEFTTKNYSRYLMMALLLYYGYLALYVIPPKRNIDKNWKEYAKRLEKQQNKVIVIPINPEGWTITIKK